MADSVIAASLKLDTSSADQSVKSFKAQLREAQQEVVAVSGKFGETSEQAFSAAKRVAELKDRIGDAKKLVDSFNPDEKFRGFAQALTGVAGGFSAVTGAMNLLGVESQDVQKQLLKVQSALAITQGLNSVGDSIQSFKNLGATLVQTLGKSGLIGIAIAGVAALAAGFLGLFDSANKATDAQKALTQSYDEETKAVASATEEVKKVKGAFDLAREGVISKQAALKEYNETLGDSFGKTNDLLAAEKLVVEKADAYIQITGLKAKANALFGISSQKYAEALVKYNKTIKDEEGKTGTRSQDAVIQASEDRKVLKDAAADIDALGQDFLKQAGELEEKYKIVSKTQQSVNKDAAEAYKAYLEQLRKDFAEETRLRAEHLVQGVDPAVAGQVGKTLEEQTIDRVAAAHKAFRDEQLKNDVQYTEGARLQAYERQKIDEAEFNHRQNLAAALSTLLNNIAQLFGKQTVAGKALAIASATIDTYRAANSALKADYGIFGPAAQIARFISVATTIAAGLKNVREIAKTNIPGVAGGGSAAVPNISVSAPVLPPNPTQSSTALDQDALNNAGNATVRAFVLDADVADNRERYTRLSRAARLGG